MKGIREGSFFENLEAFECFPKDPCPSSRDQVGNLPSENIPAASYFGFLGFGRRTTKNSGL